MTSARMTRHSTLTIDKKGSAKTASALAYGTYVLHQTKTGAKDTEKIDDQIIEIGKDITSEGLNYKTYTYLYNNKPFEAYLKVVKGWRHRQRQYLRQTQSIRFTRLTRMEARQRLYNSIQMETSL